MKLLVTGGCGFIGSNFLRAVARDRACRTVNLDALTYAGKLSNLEGLGRPRHLFVKGDIRDRAAVRRLFRRHRFDAVVNFAAESHVDRSIRGPRIFLDTNAGGTMNLLECALEYWKNSGRSRRFRFIQVSTDEVYGSLPENKPRVKFTEKTPLDPSSPYSASKAAADHLAFAYHRTFGLPVIVTRCSNNYGPYQDTEKFIPLMITRALGGRPLPVYGDGRNVRDWIHVGDHCAALCRVLKRGKPGRVYNIGGDAERRNIDIARLILRIVGASERLIRFVSDRPGHDRRYAMDSSRIRRELGWRPRRRFEEGLRETVQWYAKRRYSK